MRLLNAVSLGGDSDTLACITGGIAEAFYGMPQELRNETLKCLPEDLWRLFFVQVLFCKMGKHGILKAANRNLKEC